MKKYTDKFFANNLLEKRKANSTILYCYKRTLKVNIISIFVCLIGTALLFMLDIGIGFPAIYLGLFIGAFARDLGWFISIKKSWPFTEKVIDWQKVEELADINTDTK